MDKGYKKNARYMDTNGRLLVLLNCWYKVIDNKTFATTVDILDVSAETIHNYSEKVFENWINKKLIKRINN